MSIWWWSEVAIVVVNPVVGANWGAVDVCSRPARRSRLRVSEKKRGGLRKIASLDLRDALTRRSKRPTRLSRSFALTNEKVSAGASHSLGSRETHPAARTRGISVISSSTRESRLVTISAGPESRITLPSRAAEGTPATCGGESPEFRLFHRHRVSPWLARPRRSDENKTGSVRGD